MFPSRAIAAALFFVAASSAQATTLSIEFSGKNTFNEGFFDVTSFSGVITLDSSGAVSKGSGQFENVVASIDLTLGTGSGETINVTTSGPSSSNRAFQVTPPSTQDIVSFTYEGGLVDDSSADDFAKIGMELRWDTVFNIFDDVNSLFGNLTDGQVFSGVGTSGDIDWVALNLFPLVNNAPLDWTLLNSSDFDSLTVRVSGATGVVPLPAGLPLLGAGLAVLGLVRHRRRRD
ncbi:MAG: hypothetical protein Tsb0019_38550 [Roseibium sp.]